MKKVSRKEWMSNVLKLLETLSEGNGVNSSYARQLLDYNHALEKIAQMKRKNVKKLMALNAIRNKPKVLVDKEDNDRLKVILIEAMAIVERE